MGFELNGSATERKRQEEEKKQKAKNMSINLIDYKPKGISGHVTPITKNCLRKSALVSDLIRSILQSKKYKSLVIK